MNDRTRCTAAIAHQDVGGLWRLIGGGVCIRISSHAYLLSAGHVLAAMTLRPWLGVAGRMLPLYGAAILGDGPDAPPQARTLDIGFAPLLHGVNSPEPVGCVTLDAVDLDDDPPSQEYVAIAAADASAATWRTIAARPAERSAYRSCGVDPATHVVVDADGPVESPGVMGCGVWRRRDDPRGDLLTGMVIAKRPIDGGARTRIVATRAPLLLLGIFGFLGVRPGPWMSRRRQGRAPRRPH